VLLWNRIENIIINRGVYVDMLLMYFIIGCLWASLWVYRVNSLNYVYKWVYVLGIVVNVFLWPLGIVRFFYDLLK